MGKTQTSPRLGKGRIGSCCLTEDGNRRFPLTELKEGDSQIAKHRKPARSESLALFEADAGRLEPAVVKMLDALEEQGTRLRKLLVGRRCVISHVTANSTARRCSRVGYHAPVECSINMDRGDVRLRFARAQELFGCDADATRTLP